MGFLFGHSLSSATGEEMNEDAATVEEPTATTPEQPVAPTDAPQSPTASSLPPPLLQPAEDLQEEIEVDKTEDKSVESKSAESKADESDEKKEETEEIVTIPADDEESAPILRPEIAAAPVESVEEVAKKEEAEESTESARTPPPPAIEPEEPPISKPTNVIWSPVSNLADEQPPVLTAAPSNSSTTTTSVLPATGASPLASILKSTPAIALPPPSSPATSAAPSTTAPKKRAPRPKKSAAAKKAEQQAAAQPMIVQPNMMFPQFIQNANGAVYAFPQNLQFVRPAGGAAGPQALRYQPNGQMGNGNFYLLQNPPSSAAQSTAGPAQPPQLTPTSTATSTPPTSTTSATKGGSKVKNTTAGDGPPVIQRMQPAPGQPPNLFPLMYANANGTWRPPTAAVNQNGQYIITTPTSGFNFKPAATSNAVGGGAATSKAGASTTNSTVSAPTGTPAALQPTYTTTMMTLANGETQQFYLAINPATQQARPAYTVVKKPDGTQQLMQINSWSSAKNGAPPNLMPLNTTSAGNLSDCPPPPTLSPNPLTSAAPPPAAGGKSPKAKKRKNGSNGSTAPSLTAELPAGAFPMAGGSVFMPAGGGGGFLIPTNGDELMDVDGDDEKPPKIEPEDGGERNGVDGLSAASKQKTHAAFVKVAQSQQQNGAAPRIVQHFVDGHVIEEEIDPQGARSNANRPTASTTSGPSPKQRKIAQPPFSAAASKSNGGDEEAARIDEFRQIAQRQVKWVPTTKTPAATSGGTKQAAKNQQTTASGGANRAIFVQNQAPVFRPANYQPDPPPTVKKEPQSPTKTSNNNTSPPLALSGNRDAKSLVGRPPTTKPATTSTITPSASSSFSTNAAVGRSRGRPPKFTKNAVDSITPLAARLSKPQPASAPRRMGEDEAEIPAKRVKSAGNTPAAAVDQSTKSRKNREIEGLLTMDFGPGKTPFKTTNPDLFTENILTSQQRIQSHVRDSDDGRTSRASVASSASHSRHHGSSSRRSTRQESVVRNRPRRVVQQNGAYSKMLDDGLESEDEEEEQDGDYEEEFPKEERPSSQIPPAQSRSTPTNRCLNCGKSSTSDSLPQYCSKECQNKFKKKQRVEIFSRRLQTSGGGSRSSSSMNDSNGRASLDYSNGNSSTAPPIGSPTTPTAVNIKIRSPNSGGNEVIRCDGTGSGAFRPAAHNTSGNDELGILKTIGIQSWDAQQTARWAELVSGSADAGKKFLEEEIDGDVLLQLTEDQLKSSLGLKLGPMVKIVRDLNEMKKQLSSS